MVATKTKSLLLIEDNGEYYLIPHDEIVSFRVSEDQKAELSKLFGDEVTGYKAWAEGTVGPHMESTTGPHMEGTTGPHMEGTMGPHVEGTTGPHMESTMGPHMETIVGRPMALWIGGWPVKY
ncbi:MAG TPA: hypothetical protein VHS06_08045 [Chloroflexota bacterium]|nr:hypothetical protein [Chloroflexota bacterium]